MVSRRPNLDSIARALRNRCAASSSRSIASACRSDSAPIRIALRLPVAMELLLNCLHLALVFATVAAIFRRTRLRPGSSIRRRALVSARNPRGWHQLSHFELTKYPLRRSRPLLSQCEGKCIGTGWESNLGPPDRGSRPISVNAINEQGYKVCRRESIFAAGEEAL